MTDAYAPWAIPGATEREAATVSLGGALAKQRVIIATPTVTRSINDNHRRCVDELRNRMRDNVLPLDSIPPGRDSEQGSLCVDLELLEDANTGFTGVLSAPRDLSRTRDRMARMVLERTNADWLLWWDDDVWGREIHRTLSCMLTVAMLHERHVLGALYPRKQRDDACIVEAVRRGKTDPLRHGFALQDMRFMRSDDFSREPKHEWLLPCNGVGFGFCLVSRVALIALTERHRGTAPGQLSWLDHILGGHTVGLHNEPIEGGYAFSEDYAFCRRAGAAGFEVDAYIGPGSPMIHDGTESFEAAPECLGVVRK